MTEILDPPYEFLPPRFRNTPYDELPEAMKRRLAEQQQLTKEPAPPRDPS